jgi:hypothetical protein
MPAATRAGRTLRDEKRATSREGGPVENITSGSLSTTSEIATSTGARRGGARHRNHADPMIVLPWRVWARLLERLRR